jgi:hypothetical protein
MPKPKRKKNETVTKYRSRLVRFYINEGRSPEQAVAISHSITGTSRKPKKRKKSKKK